MDKINILKKKINSHLWTDKPEVINSYIHEQRGNLSGKSLLLLKPKNTQDVSEIIKICNKYKISIIPQGGRTGLCGGTVPSMAGDEVLITTEKMDKIINIDKENFNIVVTLPFNSSKTSLALVGLIFPYLFALGAAKGRLN